MNRDGAILDSVILIVEDQETDALVLAEAVRDLGDLRVAMDGPSALALAKRCKPDLVLLDIELQGMNGFAVCKAMKSDPELCDAAIIFVTSHSQTDNEVRALEYGGVDFISKPVNLPLARAHIKAHLALRSEAKRLANHDALTGLPNRILLQDRSQQALREAESAHARVAMLLLNIDNFKTINDIQGPSIGDALLVAVAGRLSNTLRTVDTVSRHGGDEFVVLSPEVIGFEELGGFAADLLSEVSAPLIVKGERYDLSASIGISVFPDDSQDVESLYRHASAAMYQAKIDGRNRFRFFSPDIERSTRSRYLLEQQMRSALKQSVFEVFYQAKVVKTSAEAAKVVGMEALVRWRGPDGGVISPADFIPLAEKTRLIIPLGRFVLRQACLDAQRLVEQGMPLVVSVNISAVQFVEESFLDTVSAILRDTRLKPELLELEITEGVLAKDVSKTQKVLAALKEQGIRIAIDDFGTGYSSLAYLKRFSVDVLKIDQSFVRDMLSSNSDAAIVEAIIKLAHALDLELVAEGVETIEQADALRELGCQVIQGFLYSRPEPFAQFCTLVRPGSITP